MKFIIVYIFGLLALSMPSFAEDRIMSLDYCADQFVLALADRDQIIGVSNEARDPHSFYRERAQNIPRFRADIDQVLSQKPSLVVRSWAGDRRMLSLLQQLNIPVVTIKHFEDPKEIHENLHTLAQAIGQEARAADLVADAEKRLTALQSQPKYETNALYLTPGAFTTGSGTFVDKVMKLAGIGNRFADQGYEGWFPIPMEHLVLSPPDLIVTSFYDSNSAVQNHWGVARHGYIHSMLNKTPTIDVPGSMMACSGLFLVEAAEHLRQQMNALLMNTETKQ